MTLEEYDELFQTMPLKKVLLQFSDGSFITNDRIVQESLELEESLCADMNLKYGGCEASEFRIRVVNDHESTFKDLWVDVIILVKDDEGVYITDDDDEYLTDDGKSYGYEQYSHVKLGRYKVYSDKPTNDRVYRDLVCYDAMYDLLNVDIANWYNNLTFPMTLKDFRDSLFTALNFVQEPTTLINDSYSIKGGYTTTQLSSKDILMNICELNGVFGHIDSEGKFQYISLPSDDSVELAHYQNGSGSYEDYETSVISGIISYSADGNIGVEIGTKDNPYVIDNNLLMYGDEGTDAQRTALTNLLNKVKTFSYRPFSVRTYGNPMLRLGTNIVVNTTYQTIESFVMVRYLQGIQSMKDTYTAYGNIIYPSDINQLQSIVKRTSGKAATIDAELKNAEATVVLKVDSDGHIGTATLKSDGTVSSFDINVDSIKFKANSVMNLSSARLSISSTNFSVDTAGNVTATALTLNGGSINLNNVFKVSSSGAMTATSGSIAGFNINSTALYYGATSISDTSHDGVYFGRDGSANFVSGVRRTYIQNGNLYSGNIQSSYGYFRETVSPSGTVVLSAAYTGNVASFYKAEAVNLSVSGTKSKVVDTKDYGKRLLYCYETPSPLFGDVGEGVIAEDGKCYIWLDSVFAQTINSNGYQVFLQKYGQGECYVSERKSNYFVVEGDSGLAFGWEIKAKQIDYEMTRLEKDDSFVVVSRDYGEIADEHLSEIRNEREVA